MSKQELTNHYINYIKEFNMDIIHGMNEGDISHYEAEFPSNSEELEAFISAFKHIFPHATHSFSRYKVLLSGLTKMEEDNEFKDSELYFDIVDYIGEEALEELQDQISKYPLLEDVKLFDFKSYIEELNEDLGFDGANSEVIQDGIDEYENYEIFIVGKNHTILDINLEHQDLAKHLKNNNLEMFILKNYEEAIIDFNADEVFDELYEDLSSEYRPSELLKRLEADKQYMIEQVQQAQKYNYNW